MAMLTDKEKELIAAAVSEAESKTGGEIVTAIIPESDDYAAREMVFGVAVAVLTFIIAAFSSPSIDSWLDRLIWLDSPAILPMAIGVISLATGTLAYVLAQIPAIDRIVVGRNRMAMAVRQRALRHFVESAAYDTVDRTGVLLFVSTLERRVELIADRGINEKVAPDTWDRIVSELVRGVKDDKAAVALKDAVLDIGTVLAEHVPPRPDDENELSDGPVELGRGS